MKKIKYIISLIVLSVLFSGCFSQFRNVSPNERIENDYISFQAPNTDWKIWKKYKKYHNSQIGIDNDTPKGANYDITIHTDPEYHKDSNLFKKDADFREKNADDYFKRHEKSFSKQSINYAYSDQQYVKGMKCYNVVRGRGMPAIVDAGIIKDYQLWCGYYDSSEKEYDGKRRLVISYWFKYYPGNTRLQKDKNTPSNEIKSRDELEMDLKNQVKQLIDSLVIKNFDIERMKKEGLYHPDKQYEHMKY